jgi:hypothetical protein
MAGSMSNLPRSLPFANPSWEGVVFSMSLMGLMAVPMLMGLSSRKQMAEMRACLPVSCVRLISCPELDNTDPDMDEAPMFSFSAN